VTSPSSPTAAPLPAGDGQAAGGSDHGSADASEAPGTTAAGSGRPLSEQGRERQQQLIDAAVALFSERGYAATRIRDICDRAGVAKGLFYWYFPTKLDLFAELVRTMRRRLRRAQAAAMDPDADALTRLRQGTVASVVFMAEHAEYFALVDVERADPNIADTLRAGSQVYLDDVTALLREAQRDGDVIDTDPHVLALGVLGAVSSYSNAWRAGRVDMTPDELAEFVAGWVGRALR
jgi:AcrR family transcriptional regulator